MAAPKMPGNMQMRKLDASVLDGFDITQIKCRACSGYGNCGYKSYFLKEEGGVASICMRERKRLQCKRDGIEYSDELLRES